MTVDSSEVLLPNAPLTGKNMKYIRALFLLPLLALLPPEGKDALQDIRQQWQLYQSHQPQESMYLSLSEKVVVAGDTLWFGGHLRHQSSPSRILYLELMGNGQSLQKETYTINRGLISGQVSIPDTLSSGLYQLRAYTQWMRNGDPSAFFKRHLLVVNPYEEDPAIPMLGQNPDTQLRVVPVGGEWVSGQPGQLSISLGGQENQGLSGRIMNTGDSSEVAQIQLKQGYDLVQVKPEADCIYRAELFLPSGDTLATSLPAASPEGISLITEVRQNQISIKAYTQNPGEHYLLVRSRDSLLHSSQLENTTSSVLLTPELDHAALLEIAVLDKSYNAKAQRLLYLPAKYIQPIIRLDKTTFAPREEVPITISLPPGVSPAHVSFSVRQVSAPSLKMIHDITLPWTETTLFTSTDTMSTSINQFLISQESPFVPWREIVLDGVPPPTFRKEDDYFLLSGRLTSPSGQALQNEITLLSVPGDNPHFDYDRTDSLGRFFIPVYDVYGQNEVVFQLQNDSIPTEWILEDKFAPSNGQSIQSDSAPLVSQEVWTSFFSQYQHRNRILAQYDNRAQAEETNVRRKSRFYGAPNFEVKLADYIALPDFVEVCRELMPGIRLRENEGQYVFSVFDVRTRTFLENPPALLLDGVLVYDPNLIATLDPADIERIETVNRRTYYGEYRFDGMIAVYTHAGDAYRQALPSGARQQEVTFLTPKRPYTRQSLPPRHQPHLPTLLAWKPGLRLTAEEPLTIEVSNGDGLGTFEIVVEGTTDQGQAIHATQSYQISLGPPSQE